MAMTFTSAGFETEVLGASVPVMVDFFATWCGPCKMMSPAVDALAAEYEGKAMIGKLDIDENGDIAARYGVMSVPTVIIFKNGQIADKLVGLQSKDTLKKVIEAAL